MPPYRIGNVFMLIKFTCNPSNTHLFVVLFLRGRERERRLLLAPVPR